MIQWMGCKWHIVLTLKKLFTLTSLLHITLIQPLKQHRFFLECLFLRYVEQTSLRKWCFRNRQTCHFIQCHFYKKYNFFLDRLSWAGLRHVTSLRNSFKHGSYFASRSMMERKLPLLTLIVFSVPEMLGLFDARVKVT